MGSVVSLARRRIVLQNAPTQGHGHVQDCGCPSETHAAAHSSGLVSPRLESLRGSGAPKLPTSVVGAGAKYHGITAAFDGHLHETKESSWLLVS